MATTIIWSCFSIPHHTKCISVIIDHIHCDISHDHSHEDSSTKLPRTNTFIHLHYGLPKTNNNSCKNIYITSHAKLGKTLETYCTTLLETTLLTCGTKVAIGLCCVNQFTNAVLMHNITACCTLVRERMRGSPPPPNQPNGWHTGSKSQEIV